RPPRRSPPPAPGRAPSLLESFNCAVEGIIHVLRTQRNLRIHFLAAVLVFAGAIAVGVSRLQLIALVIAIAFVLVAEMLNTAIEGVIDVSTTSFDPNAKLAKDIAAGAVLIASITAVAIGFLVFSSAVGQRTTHVLDRVRDAPADITLVALVLVVLIVIGTKAWTGRGTPLRGGLPSGHAALAFAGWVAVTYLVSGAHRRHVPAAPARGLPVAHARGGSPRAVRAGGMVGVRAAPARAGVRGGRLSACAGARARRCGAAALRRPGRRLGTLRRHASDAG